MDSCVDMVYVLKLDKNNEKEMRNHLEEVGIKRFQFYSVPGCVSDKNEGDMKLSLLDIMSHNPTNAIAQDITQNHVDMIKKAYMDGYTRVLFLEEDARLEKEAFEIKKWQPVSEWIQNCPKWDIFYLGYCNWPLVMSFLITTRIVKVWDPLLAHAYILNKRGMEKILNFTENGVKNMEMHIDKMYTRIPNFQKYACLPMVAFQNKDPALHTKACDHLNIRLSIKSLCWWNQYISVAIPILILIFIAWLTTRMFFF